MLLRRLWRGNSGASLIEYAFLVAIMTSLIVVGIVVAGSWAHGMWTHLLTSLSG